MALEISAPLTYSPTLGASVIFRYCNLGARESEQRKKPGTNDLTANMIDNARSATVHMDCDAMHLLVEGWKFDKQMLNSR